VFIIFVAGRCLLQVGLISKKVLPGTLCEVNKERRDEQPPPLNSFPDVLPHTYEFYA